MLGLDPGHLPSSPAPPGYTSLLSRRNHLGLSPVGTYSPLLPMCQLFLQLPSPEQVFFFFFEGEWLQAQARPLPLGPDENSWEYGELEWD